MWKDVLDDYRRYAKPLRNPAFWVVATYRFGRWSQGLPGPARSICSAAYGALLTASELILGTTLHRETEIGERFHVVHADGIRIDPRTVIGARVGIMQGVTIGTSPDRDGAPVIGDDVFIGAGAKILGPIRVGDRARVAANSLVLNDVPPDTTAIGVPARIIRFTGREPGAGDQPAPTAPAAAETK